MQSKIYDVFMEKLGKAMDAELRTGHGFDPTSTQGPLINVRAAEKVLSTSWVLTCILVSFDVFRYIGKSAILGELCLHF